MIFEFTEALNSFKIRFSSDAGITNVRRKSETLRT